MSSNSANEPLVTIAIPTFNRASWLPGCIRSALAQTYRHFEVLVSDNASTDQTAEVLKQFDDRRLRVVRQKSNIGLIGNFNACLAAAQGDYIVILPDDDKIVPSMLQRFLDVLSGDSQIPIIISLSGTYFPGHDHTWRPPLSRRLETGLCEGIDILQEYLRGKLTTNICSMMFYTKALRASGGFPIDFPHAVDVAAWAPLLLTGKAGFVNECCGFTSAHQDSTTSRLDVDTRLKDVRKLADLIIRLADNSIDDLQKRHAIKQDADCFFALRLFQNLAWCRQDGAKLRVLLPVLWEWRRYWTRIGVRRAFRLRRPLAILFLPKPIADALLRLLTPVYRYMLSWK